MAKRLRARPSNTQLLIAGSSLVLILVVIAGLNRPLPTYLIAATNLAPGVVISEVNVTSEELDLGSIANTYATKEDVDGKFLVQPVASGELIPLRALGSTKLAGRTSVRFTPDLKPAVQITPGALVAVWQVVEVDEKFQSQLLVPTAQVTDVVFGDGLFAGELPEVELLITESQASLILEAIAAEAAIYLLPLP